MHNSKSHSNCFVKNLDPTVISRAMSNEFCCVCRTVRFWDLEKFQVVSCIEEEATPVRYIKFLLKCTRQTKGGVEGEFPQRESLLGRSLGCWRCCTGPPGCTPDWKVHC